MIKTTIEFKDVFYSNIRYYGVRAYMDGEIPIDVARKFNNDIYTWMTATFGHPHSWPPLPERHWIGNDRFFYFTGKEDRDFFVLKWTG